MSSNNLPPTPPVQPPAADTSAWSDPAAGSPPANSPHGQALPPLRKNPLYAAILSVVPGIGHVYDGLYLRGITFFVLIMALMTLAKDSELIVFAVFFAWIFTLIDAVRQATLINHGYAQDLGLIDLPAHPRSRQSGLIMGILLFVIGLYAALEKYLDIDLDWVVQLWPVALIVIGSWMMWGWYRDRQQQEEIEPATGQDDEG